MTLEQIQKIIDKIEDISDITEELDELKQLANTDVNAIMRERDDYRNRFEDLNRKYKERFIDTFTDAKPGQTVTNFERVIADDNKAVSINDLDFFEGGTE